LRPSGSPSWTDSHNPGVPGQCYPRLHTVNCAVWLHWSARSIWHDVAVLWLHAVTCCVSVTLEELHACSQTGVATAWRPALRQKRQAAQHRRAALPQYAAALETVSTALSHPAVAAATSSLATLATALGASCLTQRNVSANVPPHCASSAAASASDGDQHGRSIQYDRGNGAGLVSAQQPSADALADQAAQITEAQLWNVARSGLRPGEGVAPPSGVGQSRPPARGRRAWCAPKTACADA
jgi:hypothetical protein